MKANVSTSIDENTGINEHVISNTNTTLDVHMIIYVDIKDQHRSPCKYIYACMYT